MHFSALDRTMSLLSRRVGCWPSFQQGLATPVDLALLTAQDRSILLNTISPCVQGWVLIPIPKGSRR